MAARRTKNTAPVSDEYKEVAGDDDEYVERKGKDFAPTIDFEETPVLVGIYEGSREVDTANGDRTIHSFSNASTATSMEPGAELTAVGELDAWGAAIFDSRVEGLEGSKVKVIKTGKKLSSKKGNQPWEFKVFESKAARAARTA